MDDKRVLKRRQTTFYMEVMDAEADKPIGKLTDITSSGIMITGKDPVKTDSEYRLSLDLPNALDGEKRITFKARSIWCRHDDSSELYDTGFEMHNLSQEKIAAIERSIRSYLFQD
jgi:hypothetical protein